MEVRAIDRKPWAPYSEVTPTGLTLCPKHVRHVRPFETRIIVALTTAIIERMMR